MRIICASHNNDKIAELKALINRPGLDLVSCADLGFTEEIEENGRSYRENALIKARAVFATLGGPVLADDSGLSLDALDGYPGIYSARFAGHESPYSDKIQKLWDLLKDVPEAEWTCAFHCALAYIDAEGREHVFEGRLDGILAHELRGSNGFGYDPVFYLPERGLTCAELSPEEKNRISHRGRAVALFRTFLAEQQHG